MRYTLEKYIFVKKEWDGVMVDFYLYELTFVKRFWFLKFRKKEIKILYSICHNIKEAEKHWDHLIKKYGNDKL